MTTTVKKIGEALLKNCPDNDCLIFKNLYIESKEIQKDLKVCELGFYSRNILEAKCRRIDTELHRMTYENYAIHQFKKGL